MSFWKNLAKYALMAAPIVAAPFTGGASLALIGAASGAAGGLLNGGGVKGALLGAGLGAIPGATGAGKAAGALVPSLTTGLKQVGTEALSGAGTNFATGAGIGALTGGGVKGALTSGLSSTVGGLGATGAGSGSMNSSTTNAILQALKTNGPAIAGAAGAALSGAAKGSEADRKTANDYGLSRDQLGISASTANERALEQRAQLDIDQHAQAQKSGESAFQNALRAAVVQNFAPAARPNGVANISFINGGPSGGAKDAAAAMEHEAMQRLLNGESFAPMPAFSPYQLASGATPEQAGTLEKILGITGTGLSGYAGVMKDLKKTNPYGESPT